MVSKCLSLHPHLHPSPITSAIFQNPSPSHFPATTSFFSTTKLTVTHHRSQPSLLGPRCSIFTPMASFQSTTSPEYDEFEAHPSLTNDDLKPTTPLERSFSWLEMSSLWIGLVVGVPSYYLAGSLVDLGMAWWQGIATVVAANVILLVPLVLTGHPGTRYGISFPVLARSSFGIRGAHIPTLLRAFVGCGWYGIETWIGGEAIFLLLPKFIKESTLSQFLPWLGTSPLEFACFIAFWLAQLTIVWKGMEGIRELEKYSAPILIVLTSCLLTWAYVKAGGFGYMLSLSSRLSASQFWSLFFPSLTANISFWATLALNIPDFTRYAKSQTDQVIGQAGLPIFMGHSHLLAWLSPALPNQCCGACQCPRQSQPLKVHLQKGALLTALLGIAFQPWRLLRSSESFVYTWLVGYSALLGPIGGIILTDYYLIHRTNLSIKDLYSLSPYGLYYYSGGYNLAAMAALVVGILPVIPGFLEKVGVLSSIPGSFGVIYNNAWFFSFFSAGLLYWLLSCFTGKQDKSLPADPLLQSAK
ncbi:hypothetical protein SLA2020_437830 [Shorea laevis]